MGLRLGLCTGHISFYLGKTMSLWFVHMGIVLLKQVQKCFWTRELFFSKFLDLLVKVTPFLCVHTAEKPVAFSHWPESWLISGVCCYFWQG